MAGDVLLGDPTLTPHSIRTIGRIKSAVGEMESLVEAFLIMARDGDVGLPDEDFVVNEVIQDEIGKARPLLDHKPVELKFEEHAAFALHAPPRVFAVLFGNLLRNACNYTDTGCVTVRVQPGKIVIDDTGVGMTPEEIEHVFDPFYRGGEQCLGGHGIGLNIVRRLSERFGWPVAMESEAGKGTRATVQFPKAQQLEG
jgi:signal transduction histidine kinase